MLLRKVDGRKRQLSRPACIPSLIGAYQEHLIARWSVTSTRASNDPRTVVTGKERRGTGEVEERSSETLIEGPSRHVRRGWRARRGGRGRRHREKERINALKQQAATTLIGHFVHLFDLFKLWDN